MKHQPLGAFMQICCVLAHADPDLLSDSNRLDRMTVGATAVTLACVWVLGLLVWTAFFATVLPLALALPAAATVITLIVLLDRAFAASDWHLDGVLRAGRWDGGRCLKVCVRLALAVLFSFATAWAAALVVSRGETEALLRAEAATANAPIKIEYDEKAQAMRARLVGPLEAELKSLADERQALLAAMASREEAIGNARAAANTGRVEADRQKLGDQPGYRKGEGPRFAEARRLTEVAAQLSAESAGDMERLRKRLGELTPVVERKAAELRAQAAGVEAAEAAVREAMLADPRWQAQRSGPLAQFAALTRLKQHPTLGPEIVFFERLVQAVLLGLELAALALKMLGSHASVYTTMLIRRTKLDAAREAHALNEGLRTLRERAGKGLPNGGLGDVTDLSMASGQGGSMH